MNRIWAQYKANTKQNVSHYFTVTHKYEIVVKIPMLTYKIQNARITKIYTERVINTNKMSRGYDTYNGGGEECSCAKNAI